jgi:ATP-dependent exoDNAse (exonuclease V) beta subunit
MAASIRFISAGAGSGKTYTLTEILHRELSEGRAQPGGVLATTFTTKAATELRERVRSHLIRQNAYALANAMGQARIGTVNSVCGGLLQRFAFEAGMPTEQRVLDEEHSGQLLREAIDLVMERQALAELLKVARRLSLDEAGHGGGEVPWRKDLRSLVDQARANGIDADTLRGFGETNAANLLAHFPRATDEDLDRRLGDVIEAVLPAIRAAVEQKGKQNTTKYLHRLETCLRDLSHDRMTWAQWTSLSQEDNGPEAGLKPTVQPVTDAAARYAQHPHLHADLRDYLRRMFGLAADALQAYDNLKLQLGAIDFTDQERKLLDVLDLPFVAETLAAELDLLMVDEFQDTSPIQLALFLKLAGLAGQVVWVGDVKQAIYGFRGSDTALMKAVLAALPDLGGRKDVLPNSWRSRPALVGLVNHLFANGFDGLTPEEVVLHPMREEPGESPALLDWVLEGRNKGQIAESLASGIARLMTDGTQVIDRETKNLRPVRLSDIAILLRANTGVQEIASTLRLRGIASSTAQPGLLAQPELVLAQACLRRLNDPYDTLATAEIVSLADCDEPEQWLADRMAWLESGSPVAEWKEGTREGDVAAPHPILAAIKALRAQGTLLTPREAVELVLTRCGIARRVVQWQQDADSARLRLANLDRLAELSAEYEDECHTTRQAGTLSGFLLWLQDLAAGGLDALPQPGVDAVSVMTHHGAKGLEWPVVVLCDLAGDIKDRLWDIQAESRSGFDVHRPLHDRFLRYWPWPFGAQKKVALADEIAASATGIAAHAEAVEEHKRLLYVSMTRARDMLVLAREGKKLVGPWMSTVSLDNVLRAEDAAVLALSGGHVPYRRDRLDGASANLPRAGGGADLAWFVQSERIQSRLPLTVSPSASSSLTATVVDTAPFGARLDTSDIAERSLLGDAIHACLAADLACPSQPISVEAVRTISARMGIDHPALIEPLHGQLAAIRQWLQARWPEMEAIVELPMMRLLENGQRVAGRSDLLIRTPTGWVLLDYKSTPAGSAQWEALASTHAGQLAAYRDVIEAASGLPVEEVWLVLPVAGVGLRVEIRPTA